MKFAWMGAFLFCAMLAQVSAAEGKIEDISHADLTAAVKAKGVILIDCNGSDTYNTGHIPGAVDFQTQKEKLAEVLPKDKAALVVAYCGNEQCPAYKSGAAAALKLGYTNVKHYAGGLAGWKKSGEALEPAAK